jgi:hypothetical protein
MTVTRERQPPAPLESAEERFFFDRATMLGALVIKMAPMQAGVPDRLVIFPGQRVYFVELKRLGGTLSPIQQVYHDRMLRRYGIRIVVLHGREEIVEWLRRVVGASDPRAGRPRTKSTG